METWQNPASALALRQHHAVSAFRLSAPECQGTGSQAALSAEPRTLFLPISLVGLTNSVRFPDK